MTKTNTIYKNKYNIKNIIIIKPLLSQLNFKYNLLNIFNKLYGIYKIMSFKTK